jgi:DNA-directed RNA polymerase specialized sigma24 family protein
VPIEHLREVADLAMSEDPEQIVSLDAALCRLEAEDPHTAAVVRLRFFAGLTIEQTAEALCVSAATVKRDWQFARAWLFKALQSSGE